MKDIYRLLNHTDNDCPEAEPLTNEEVNAFMKRFRTETNTGNPEQKGKRKTITVVTALLMAACCGTAAVAADHMGVFSKLTHKKDMTFPWFGGTEELPIDKIAVPYDYEKIAEAANEVTDTVIAESEGLTIQVESIYCDGITTMIGISGSMKDGNPLHKNLIKLYPILLNMNGKDFSNNSPGYTHNHAKLDGSLVLDEGADNQFSGTIELIAFGNSEITEETTINVTIGGIMAQEHYMDLEEYVELGSLSFSVTVTPDASLRESEPYTITENGYSVRFYEISPAMMIVGFIDPDDQSCWLNDENGEQIEWVGLSELPDYGDGYAIGCMVPVTTGYVTAAFFEKGYYDENGKMINNKEIRINMDEVYAALKGTE